MEMPSDITIPEPKRVYLNQLRIDNTNPNVMSEANFEALKLNIKRFGFIIPIITNEDYVIADGYHRWKAARELGMSEVLVIKLPLKEVDRRMLRQILNKLRGEHNSDKDIIEYNFFDESGCLDELETLLPDFSVDIGDLNTGEVEEDDFVPDLEKPPKYEVLRGQVWQLGEHRLMCGDSTDKTDVDILMDGDKADMVFTDPPYGIGYEYNSHKDIKDEEYLIFCDKWFDNIKKNNLVIITTGWKYNLFWHSKKPYDTMTWVMKGKHTGGKASHFRICEPIFIFGKVYNKYNFDWFETTNKLEFVGDINLRDLHTCPKPLDLLSDLISPQTKIKNIVLDIFGGSGSTLIACEQLNRKCYMMELDPKYCSVIIERWEALTNKEAQKLGE